MTLNEEKIKELGVQIGKDIKEIKGMLSAAASSGSGAIHYVEDIASLRAVETPKVGDFYFVACYDATKSQKQGGGLFIAEESWSVDDRGYNIKPDSEDFDFIIFRRVSSDAGRAYVEEFGATGDDDEGIINSEAYKNCVTHCFSNQKVMCSMSGQVHKVDSKIIVYGGIELDLMATIEIDTKEQHITDENVIRGIVYIGNSRVVQRNKSVRINNIIVSPVFRKDETLKTTVIGLTVIGSKCVNFKLGEIEGLDIIGCDGDIIDNVFKYGDEYAEFMRDNVLLDTHFESVAYNKFDIDMVSHLRIIGYGSNGWVNENTFDIRRFRSKVDDYASITIEGVYSHNHNIINRGTCEGRVEILFKTGRCNYIRDLRFERYTHTDSKETLLIDFAEGTFGNRISTTWYMSSNTFINAPYDRIDGAKLVDVRDRGIDNTIVHEQELNSDDFKYLYLTPNTPYISHYNTTTGKKDEWLTDIENLRYIVHLPNGLFKVQNNYKEIYNPKNLIPVNQGAMFLLESDEALFRVDLHIFDSSMQPIKISTDNVESYHLKIDGVNMKGVTPVNKNKILFTIKSKDVAYIKPVIISGNGTADKTFSYLKCTLRQPKVHETATRKYLEQIEPKRKPALCYTSAINIYDIGENIPCYAMTSTASTSEPVVNMVALRQQFIITEVDATSNSVTVVGETAQFEWGNMINLYPKAVIRIANGINVFSVSPTYYSNGKFTVKAADIAKFNVGDKFHFVIPR